MCCKKFTIPFIIALVATSSLFVPTKRAEAIVSCIPTVATVPDVPLSVPVQNIGEAARQTIANVFHGSNFTKECILDAMVTFLKESLIQNLTGSIVDWINNDFEGGPAFVTDPAGFFVNIADETAGNFIETQLGPIGALLCSPFDLNLRLNLWLSTGASRKQYLGCRLTDIQQNAYEAFTSGGFIANGGWRTFNAITSDPRNNQYGAFIYASDALNTEFIKKANEKLRELSYGRGFLSFKKCAEWSEGPNEGTGEGGEKRCLRYKVETPGSLINNQLNNVFGSELRKFEYADEINEVFEALVNYGLRQVFTKDGGGLLGASKQRSGETTSAAARLRNQNFSAVYDLAKTDTKTDASIENARIMSTLNDPTARAVGATATTTPLTPLTEQNLALRKPARQSSEWRETIKNTNYVTLHEAKLAVDDNSSGWYSAAITNDSSQEWWTVDLEQPQLIGRVEIYQDPKRKFSGCLIVSKTPFGSSALTCLKSALDTVQKFQISPSATRPITITMPANTDGRYLWIQSETNDNLILLEVKAFAQTTSGASTHGGGRGGAPTVSINAVQPQNVFIAGDTYVNTLTLSTNNPLNKLTLTATLNSNKGGAVPWSTLFSSFKITSKDLIKNATNSAEANITRNSLSISNIELQQNAAATVGYLGKLRGGPNDSWRSAGMARGDYTIITELKDAAGKILETQVSAFTTN